MGDPTKFHSLGEYYAFHVVFACLLLSELFIFFYTRQRDAPDADVIVAWAEDELCGFAIVQYIDRPESA